MMQPSLKLADTQLAPGSIPTVPVPPVEEAASRAVALYDFAAQQDGDLAFAAGDVIIVTDATQTWWKGYREAAISDSGAFPSNYVKVTPPSGEIPGARVVGWEYRQPARTADSPQAGSEWATPRRDSFTSLSAVDDLELWFCLEIDGSMATSKLWRSLRQFDDLQAALAEEFSAPRDTMAVRARLSTRISLTKRSAEIKMGILQHMLDGIGVHATLRHSMAVRRFLSASFRDFVESKRTVPMVGGGTAVLPVCAGPVSYAHETQLARARRDGNIITHEVFECQRRRTHLQEFSEFHLLPTDGPTWMDASGKLQHREDVSLPDAEWSWATEWVVDWYAEMTDGEGWGYAFNFNASGDGWSGTCDGSSLVRQRRWVRVAQNVGGLTAEELLEILEVERAERRRNDTGVSLLLALEVSLAELVALEHEARNGPPEEPSTPTDDGAEESIPDKATDQPVDILVLTPSNLEVVFTQFPAIVISAVLTEYDGDPIMAAKYLASMLGGSGAAAKRALCQLGLGSIVEAQRRAEEQAEEGDVESYLQECYELCAQRVKEEDAWGFTMVAADEGSAGGAAMFNLSLGQEDSSFRSAAFLGAVCCIAGGCIRDSYTEVPAELTADDCVLLRQALLMDVDSAPGSPSPSRRRQHKGTNSVPVGFLSPVSIREQQSDDNFVLAPPVASPRVLRDADEESKRVYVHVLGSAFEMRSRLTEEFERQMYCLKTHPYYHASAFPDPEQYAAWRVKEQMRLAKAIEHMQRMPPVEGLLCFRIRQATGLHHEEMELTDKQEAAEYSCIVSLGGQQQQTTKRVRIEDGGIARWGEEFNLAIADPDPCLTIEIYEHASIKTALSDAVSGIGARVEKLGGNPLIGMLGGKKVADRLEVKREQRDERRNTVLGSTRLPRLSQMWCPPPHWKTHHLELYSDTGVAGILTFDLQYACRHVQESVRDWSQQSLFEGMGQSLESIHKNSHQIFRVMVQNLARAEFRAEEEDGGMGSGMTLAPALGWLFDQFCELFGVGEPHRRLFELRVALANFTPTAGSLGRVSVALNDVLHLEEGHIVEWTIDERDLYSAMVLHLQETISRFFLHYKSVFLPAVVQSGALELAAHIFSLITEDADTLLRTNIMQHADQMLDMILRGSDQNGNIVRPRVLLCLLQEIRRELKADNDVYRPAFPPGVELVPTHCEQYFGKQSRVQTAMENCIRNIPEKQFGEDAALQLYDSAFLTLQQIEDMSLNTQLLDLKNIFAPILGAHRNRQRDRMMVWAHNAALKDDCKTIFETETPRTDEACEGAEKLHSHGVDDLFSFCMHGVRRLAEIGTIEEAFSIFIDVMIRYCDTVIQQCEGILKQATPVRSENIAPKPSDEVAEFARKGLGLGWRAIKKMGTATAAMVDQRTVRAFSEGMQAEVDDDEEEKHLCFTVPSHFWVRLNNLWLLSEKHVQPIGVDASQLFAVALDDVSATQLFVEDRVAEFVTRVRRQIGEIVRKLVGLTQPAVRAEICVALRQFTRGGHEPVEDVWQPVLDGLDTVLCLPHEVTYPTLFQRLMRQMVSAFFVHLEDFLAGEVMIKDWRSPGKMEICIEQAVEFSKEFFSAGGVSAARLKRLTDTDTLLGRLLVLHSQDTTALIGQYRSITNEIRSRLSINSSAVRMGDQVAEITGVLQCRQLDDGAREFVAEIGVAAHGRVPESLGLDDDEQLYAKAICRHRLAGTLYVTSTFICFAPRQETGLEGWERSLRQQEEAECTMKVSISGLSYLLKEKSSTGRETILEIGTKGDDTFSLHGFRTKGLRDDMYQHICARGCKFGLRLDVEDDAEFAPIRKMFGLASAEPLIDSFSCAVMDVAKHAYGAARGSAAQGRLYITSSFLCFRETSSRTSIEGDRRFKCILPFATIQSVQLKAESLLGFGLLSSPMGTIEITTVEGSEYSLGSFNVVTRDSTLALLRDRLDACRGQVVTPLPDGLSGGGAAPVVETRTLCGGVDGFGMNIDEDGTVTAYVGDGLPAQATSVPLNACITAVNGTPTSSRADVMALLDSRGDGDVAFEFTHPVMLPAVQSKLPSDAASNGAFEIVPFQIVFLTQEDDGSRLSPASAVTVTITGTTGSSGERVFTACQRTDFHPGQQAKFRFEATELGDLNQMDVKLNHDPASEPNAAHRAIRSALSGAHGQIAQIRKEVDDGVDTVTQQRRWNMAHAVVTNMATMQCWTFVADRVITEHLSAIDVELGPPCFVSTVVEELFQHERRLTQFSRFSSKQMFPTDRPVWCDSRHRPQYKESIKLPDGWCWDGDWQVDVSADSDADGWEYGFSWKLLVPECTSTCFVRRRRWLRVRRKVDGASDCTSAVVDAACIDDDMHLMPPPIVASPPNQSQGSNRGSDKGSESSDNEVAIE